MRKRVDGLVIGNQCDMKDIYAILRIYSRYIQFKKIEQYENTNN